MPRATVNKTREARLRAGPHLADEAASDRVHSAQKCRGHVERWQLTLRNGASPLRLALGTPPPWAGAPSSSLPSRADETPERTGPEVQPGLEPLGLCADRAPSHPHPSEIQGHCRKAWWFVCSRPMPSKSKEASPHLAPIMTVLGTKAWVGSFLFCKNVTEVSQVRQLGARHA